ncbi:MAG: glycosyltransferase [Burkholderiales bacterium]|nr:glycosyltransferase [Burkholderiales bacterium]
MMRSLHVIGGRKLGGAERFFVRLVNALHRRGHAVAAMTVAGGEIDAALDPCVPRHHAPMAGVWDLWSRLRIARAARGYDVVQTYMGRATRLTHLTKGRKPVHLARLGGYYGVEGYRHAHAWVGNTRGICTYLIEHGLPAERVYYIGNFVDPAPILSAQQLADLRCEQGIPLHAYVILGLGRLHPNKGFADLLAAFARLPGQIDGRPLWLVMVGDGPLRAELERLSHRLGIATRVVWTGWQYDPAPWYRLADLFVCPSRHEPLGNVILEAWAHGVPVVSTAAAGPSELIEHGVDGWLVPLADPQTLATTCLQILQWPDDVRAAAIAAGRRKLEQHFSEEAIVGAYLDLYERLCRQVQAAR